MDNLLHFPPAGAGAAASPTPPCDSEPGSPAPAGCVLVGPAGGAMTADRIPEFLRLRPRPMPDDLAPLPPGARRVADYIPAKAEIVRLPGRFALVRHAVTGEAVWTRVELGAVGPLYRKLGRR